jgi:hypothetical protein
MNAISLHFLAILGWLNVSNLFWQDGEAEEKAKDPGAAVALGAALLVRLLVPAWVVNATPLPISAIVLPRVRPPAPKTTKPQVCTCRRIGNASCTSMLHDRLDTNTSQHVAMNHAVQAEAAPGEGLHGSDALMSAANSLANMRVLESGYDIK